MSKKSIIMCGPPASGKSTWSKNFILKTPETNYISSDAIRKEITGSESNMTEERRVWETVRRRYEDALMRGDDVILDATNRNPQWRSHYIETAKNYGYDIIAVDCFSAIDVEACVKRNISRPRRVPQHVIEYMASTWVKPSIEEGFTKIIIT